MDEWKRDECAVFKKTKEKYGGLSNMAGEYSIHVCNRDIPTSEALFQACKFPDNPDIQDLIIAQKSPMSAKMKTKPHRKCIRSDWDEIRLVVMMWCLRIKLTQNYLKFGELLQSTGELAIVEEEPTARGVAFWGAKPIGDDFLQGPNNLGRLLMELRREYREGKWESPRVVQPPDIANFRLFGNEIGEVRG